MPSIYPSLKHSDRKFIRHEKARIRRQFSDVKKQEEMITELYKRFLGGKLQPMEAEAKEEKTAESKTEAKKGKVKKAAPKKAAAKK